MNAKAKIMVVEDDPILQGLLIELVKNRGYHAVGADNGQEALVVYSEEQPDIVITDLQMPRLDGFGFIAALKEIAPSTPVIAMSASKDLLEKTRGTVFECLHKPIGIGQLLHVIERGVGDAATP